MGARQEVQVNWRGVEQVKSRYIGLGSPVFFEAAGSAGIRRAGLPSKKQPRLPARPKDARGGQSGRHSDCFRHDMNTVYLKEVYRRRKNEEEIDFVSPFHYGRGYFLRSWGSLCRRCGDLRDRVHLSRQKSDWNGCAWHSYSLFYTWN